MELLKYTLIESYEEVEVDFTKSPMRMTEGETAEIKRAKMGHVVKHQYEFVESINGKSYQTDVVFILQEDETDIEEVVLVAGLNRILDQFEHKKKELTV